MHISFVGKRKPQTIYGSFDQHVSRLIFFVSILGKIHDSDIALMDKKLNCTFINPFLIFMLLRIFIIFFYTFFPFMQLLIFKIRVGPYSAL